MRGATIDGVIVDRMAGFQSTLPMRGATVCDCPDVGSGRISIHAPHAGSDLLLHKFRVDVIISIHAPHAGSD